ncbi:MAG: GTP cyclohydrolase II [Dermabacter sp.]|nr:GTP cyclohydrolase II [Dermabacter sp.]
MSAPNLQGIESTEAVRIPTPWGEFAVRAWRGADGEHLSLQAPSPVGAGETAPADGTATPAPLVRVHSECATGDIFGSFRCDCGEQLDSALARIAAEGGALLYLRGQEGRGIGLFDKIRAYHLQDEGADTVDANTRLGLPVDARRYDDAAHMLRSLGLNRIRLISNNPDKDRALSDLGIDVVELVPSIIEPRDANRRYLETKRDRMAHRLPSAPLIH